MILAGWKVSLNHKFLIGKYIYKISEKLTEGKMLFIHCKLEVCLIL